MDTSNLKQISRSISRQFEKWDYKKAIKLSDSEAATRDYLIEPFFEILGYTKMDDYSHEFSLPIAKGKVRKVDMVITLKGKNPSILIECKASSANLTSRNFKQLSEYFTEHKESKIGILTNGLVYNFYSRSLDDSNVLNPRPFFVFDIRDYDSNDVSRLSVFYRHSINLASIVEDAEELYFLEKFDDGLYKTLLNPNKDFVKIIYSNMGGKVLTEKAYKRVHSLINSISLSEALNKLKISEAKNSKSGIITTAIELKSFDIIKTIIAMSSKIKNSELDRIGFKDYKGFFNIIVDNSPRKSICHMILKDNRKAISIDGKEFEIESVSAKHIIKHKSALVSSALKTLKN